MEESKRSRKILVEGSAEEATALACELIKSILCETVHLEHVCHIALAGGTTPHALYQQLTASCSSGEVPWGDVEVFFGDERDVPHDDVESNYRMAQRTLLDHVPVIPSRIHPMPADSDDLPAAAEEYEKIIRGIVGGQSKGIPRFDLILLGMGGDGHVASLFPGTEVIAERNKLVTSYFVPVLGRNRMTFTFPLINAARNVLLLITGGDKAETVGSLLGDDATASKPLPAAHVDPEGSFLMVLDAAAAKRARLTTA